MREEANLGLTQAVTANHEFTQLHITGLHEKVSALMIHCDERQKPSAGFV